MTDRGRDDGTPPSAGENPRHEPVRRPPKVWLGLLAVGVGVAFLLMVFVGYIVGILS